MRDIFKVLQDFRLNLFPLPPLDGGRIMVGMLNPAMAVKYARIEPYGIWILLVLIFTGVLGKLLWPVVGLLQIMLHSLAGV